MLPLPIELPLAAALALVPTVLVLRRRPTMRGRREAALALHRERLREVDRDRRIGLIAGEEHGGARLEIERRLLAEADASERDDAVRARRWPLAVTLVAVPAAALVLYAIGGHPGWPAQPIAARLAAAAATDREDAAIIGEMKADLATLDPRSAKKRDGELLLGQAEAAHGDWAGAADAFDAALAAGFDPTIATEAAEARTRADGRVSPASAALFRRAVADAPAGAPWRTMAEERIAEAEHGR